jgi:nicotinamide phosphoribosyltransferase
VDYFNNYKQKGKVIMLDGKTMLDANIILDTDAYKHTHWWMLPHAMTYQHSYLESRGVSDKGVPQETLFYGLQITLKKYLCGVVVTQAMIEEADEFCQGVFGANYFNRKGWQKIVDVYGGKLPVRIRAVPEGTLVGSHNVLMTVESLDSELAFLPNFLETLLLRVWYPISVATTSFGIKRLIKKYAIKTGGNMFLQFHLNDFGSRGVSSKESAGIGGSAHLINFSGTDNYEGIIYAMKYYNSPVCGFSVAASEHSATIVYGEENEALAYESFMTAYPTGIISIVSDTYDLYNAVDNIFGKKLKSMILERDGKLVVRPDSGYPPEVTLQVLKRLWKHFGGTVNDHGYKVLNPKVGVIYGDFIKYGMIDDILSAMEEAGFSTDNIVFGMGGALLQQVNRDTFKFAFKASAATVNGEMIDVHKSPATDMGKASKAGRLQLLKNRDTGNFETVLYNDVNKDRDNLVTVFETGVLTKEYTFDEIKARVESYL